MEVLIVIAFILICFVFIWNCCDENNKVFSGLLLIVSSFIFTICLEVHLHGDTPNAIDVYRGKTTLEITYIDSIPVDTIVVFKNEFKK